MPTSPTTERLDYVISRLSVTRWLHSQPLNISLTTSLLASVLYLDLARIGVTLSPSERAEQEKRKVDAMFHLIAEFTQEPLLDESSKQHHSLDTLHARLVQQQAEGMLRVPNALAVCEGKMVYHTTCAELTHRRLLRMHWVRQDPKQKPSSNFVNTVSRS